MELLIKSVVIGIAGSLLYLVLKKLSPELSHAMSLAVCISIMLISLKIYGEIKNTITLVDLGENFSSYYLSPVLKCIGIGLCTKIGSDIAKDSGTSSVASALEFCGAACSLYVSLPLIKSLFRLIGEFT